MPHEDEEPDDEQPASPGDPERGPHAMIPGPADRETAGAGPAGQRPERPVPPPEVPGGTPEAATPAVAAPLGVPPSGTGAADQAPLPPPAPSPAAPHCTAPPPPPPAGTGPPWTGPASPGPLPPDPDDPRTPETRGPLRRRAAWGWGYGLAGLAVGFGPEVLLYAASLGVAASSSAGAKVTSGSAIALVVVSLVVYGWQTAAAWFFSVRIAGRRLSAWGFRLPTRAYFWTIPLALAFVYVVSFYYDYKVRPKPQDIIGEFPHSGLGIALFVILAVIMAPLFEEVFFRGFLFRAFASSWGWVPGAIVSASVFGIAHAQIDVFVPLFALGLMLAWVYKRTGSLWTSISLHALFNGISVVAWALTG